MKRIVAWIAVVIAVGLLSNAPVRAASEHGVAGVMPALYDGQLFTINFKELPEKAAESLIAHNPSLNRIYRCDSCPGSIAVLDAIQGDGFNPLWEEVQIEFVRWLPDQFFSTEEIEQAERLGGIRLIHSGEIYRCSVIGERPPPPPDSIAGETFTLANGLGDVITAEDATRYRALFGGITETGTYVWLPTASNATLLLTPDDGSAHSTLVFAFSDPKSGTFNYEETGEIGFFTLFRSLCSPNDAPVSIVGETFTFDNGDGVTADDATNYHAVFGGVAQSGTYFWTPHGTLQLLSLLPNDGRANSTLIFSTTIFLDCLPKAGTYTIQETGRSGTFTVSP